jgi:hypothetical protein
LVPRTHLPAHTHNYTDQSSNYYHTPAVTHRYHRHYYLSRSSVTTLLHQKSSRIVQSHYSSTFFITKSSKHPLRDRLHGASKRLSAPVLRPATPRWNHNGVTCCASPSTRLQRIKARATAPTHTTTPSTSRLPHGSRVTSRAHTPEQRPRAHIQATQHEKDGRPIRS